MPLNVNDIFGGIFYRFNSVCILYFAPDFTAIIYSISFIVIINRGECVVCVIMCRISFVNILDSRDHVDNIFLTLLT